MPFLKNIIYRRKINIQKDFQRHVTVIDTISLVYKKRQPNQLSD